jgi:hypothetical protein
MSIKNRFDFTSWMARASTWLAMLSAASTASLGAYALMPERVQNAFPDGVLVGLGGMAIGAAFLIPVATSFKQRNLGRATQVIVTQETKVEGDVTKEDATRIAEQVQANP